MVLPIRQLILKTLAVALVAGGNCWVCTLTAPAALAAEHHAVTAMVQCSEVTTSSVNYATVPMAADSGCPMNSHYDESAPASNETTKPVTTQFTPDGLLAAEGASLAWPTPLSHETLPNGRLIYGDRSSPLAGIIVKNE